MVRPFESFESCQLVKLYSYSFMSMILLYERGIEEESKFLCVSAYHNIVKHNLEYHGLYDFSKESKQVEGFNLYNRQANRQLANQAIHEK